LETFGGTSAFLLDRGQLGISSDAYLFYFSKLT
jgi:hypothetical protein